MRTFQVQKMEFHVYETGERIVAKERPIVIITSNNEKELPDAFLRRCFFHYIDFPNSDEMQQKAWIILIFMHLKNTQNALFTNNAQ